MELGIKGHLTRNNEVVKILEMLGGKNQYKIVGGLDNHFYYIGDKDKYINNSYIGSDEIKGYEIFSLEDFLEKFPYKVGDKVEFWSEVDYYGRTVLETSEIISMRWNSARCEVAYRLKGECKEFYKSDIKGKVIDIAIKPTKNMKEKKIKQMSLANCDLDEVEIVLGDRFELKIKEGKYYAIRKKPTYPKTYAECCDILGIDTMDNDAKGYKYLLVIQFQELLIARDAYWKIAGEQMGLGKPWEPDWNWRECKFCIGTIYDKIEKFHAGSQNCILSFPTEEMQNAFYENFKDLIERCKELL